MRIGLPNEIKGGERRVGITPRGVGELVADGHEVWVEAGVAPADVVVIGGGTAGANAARIAVGLGARVTMVERSPERIRELEAYFDGRADVLAADGTTALGCCRRADLIVGAVLVPGASAPKLLSHEDPTTLRPGVTLVDVAIDQGGCFASSRPTTHGDPVFEIAGALHYCVANIPGAVPVTSTAALTSCTLPYVRCLANQGVDGAIEVDPGLADGINVRSGDIVHPTVASALISSAA